MQNANRSFCFRALSAALALNFALFTVACMKNTATGQPTSPNAGVVAGLEAAAAGCTVTAALEKNPAISALLSGPCVSAMTGILDVVEANGAVAKIQAFITSLQSAVSALPASTPDLPIAIAAVGLAQDALNDYVQATGQTVTPVPPGASQFFGTAKAKKLKYTAAEKARIEAAKAKLATRKK